jgi:Mrp family chromosome partitioning ATPase
MSKNFELLYQAGKAAEMLHAEVEPAEPSALPEVSTSVPALQIEGMAKDEISKLVHRLFFMPGADAPHNVVFTSTDRGHGCSWMCAHVGEILASQTPGTVCLVDCNPFSSSLHQEFNMSNHHGLSDALVGDDPIRDYAKQTSRQNLWLISCGASMEITERMLSSDRMRARISQLRAQFDYVLMDVAALNTCNHGMVLGGLADGVVLVLKANIARRDSARENIQQLQASNVKVLGAVLNQRTFPIPQRIYKRL